jgi:hypothetical protein
MPTSNPNFGRRTYNFIRKRKEFRDRCERTQAPCWLCPPSRNKIDYSLPDTHPDGFNLDHMISVAERPDLAEDPCNFKPSHKACNEKRGDGRSKIIYVGEPSEVW